MGNGGVGGGVGGCKHSEEGDYTTTLKILGSVPKRNVTKSGKVHNCLNQGEYSKGTWEPASHKM